MEQISDPLIRILLIAATLALITGLYTDGWKTGWITGVSIYMAIIFIVAVTTANEVSKQRKFIHQQALVKDIDVAVIRGNLGTTMSINIWDLVVGDII